MIVPAGTQRQYWHDVLNGAGLTTLPRWPQCPRWPGQAGPGVAEHVEPLPAHLVPLRAGQLLAAHAVVLAALSGEREVTTGYVAEPGARPLPLRLTTEPQTWRELVASAARAEQWLQACREVPVDAIAAQLGRCRAAVRDRARPARRQQRARAAHRAAGDDLDVRARRKESAAPALPHRSDRRRRGRPYCPLPRRRTDAAGRRSRRSPPQPAVGRRVLLADRRSRRARPRASRRTLPRAVRAAGRRPSRHRRGRTRRPTVDLPRAQRPREPARQGAADPRAAPRRRGGRGRRAQPRLDGRGDRDLQGRRGVPADRAAFPRRADRDHARPLRLRAGADRAR